MSEVSDSRSVMSKWSISEQGTEKWIYILLHPFEAGLQDTITLPTEYLQVYYHCLDTKAVCPPSMLIVYLWHTQDTYLSEGHRERSLWFQVLLFVILNVNTNCFKWSEEGQKKECP